MCGIFTGFRILLLATAFFHNGMKLVDLIVSHGFFRRVLYILAILETLLLEAFLGAYG
jgi:hypothetical protein